jgi:hypothetical protein
LRMRSVTTVIRFCETIFFEYRMNINGFDIFYFQGTV